MLRFTTYISAAAFAAASLVQADCYGSGESWDGDSFKAVEAAQTLCSDVYYRTFANLEFKTRCVNLSSNKKVDFTITMGSLRLPIDIGQDACNDFLKREILGCEHGGRSTHTFYPIEDNIPDGQPLNVISVDADFISDPSSGQCA